MNRLVFPILIVLSILAVGAIGYAGWQFSQRTPRQEKLIKTAVESFPDDARYVSFGSDYVFAVPKSFIIDESSVAGVQLVAPSGLNDLNISNFEQLFDAAVVAVQGMKDIKVNSNSAVTQYVNKTLLPDLKKNLTKDIKVKYSFPGKHQAATIIASKDGKEIRRLYIQGGAHPVMIAAKQNSDAYLEIVSTLIGVEDSPVAPEFEALKTTVKNNMTLIQQNKITELYNAGASEFKGKTNIKDFTNAVNSSKDFVQRNVLIPGGSFFGDNFNATLTFRPAAEGQEVGLGGMLLTKVNGQWLLNGLSLPVPKK